MSQHSHLTDTQRVKQVQALTEDAFALIRKTASNRRPKGGGLETVDAARQRGDKLIALIGMMRDGLLKSSEAAAVKWEDLTQIADGSGRLPIPFSKTGRTDIVYISPSTMAVLDRIKPTVARGSIFELSAGSVSRRITVAARAAGLGEGYTGRSCRVGMITDLVATEVYLPDLHRDGRWGVPKMIGSFKPVQEGAVARYYRHLAGLKEVAA